MNKLEKNRHQLSFPTIKYKDMTSPEYDVYYSAINENIRHKIGSYHNNLHCKFGNPQVGTAQQEEIAMQAARIEYENSRPTADVLQSAYKKMQSENVDCHNKRMSTRQTTQATRPGSSQAQATRKQPRSKATLAAK